MEVVWPTVKFSDGSASVEGYPDSPSKGGNPSGPGFDFYRFFQCAQGTMGVVTWTNLKIESIPELDKVLFAPLDDLEVAIQFLHRILPRRISQESCCSITWTRRAAGRIGRKFRPAAVLPP
jgi:FAD/FMN-containing dehydrogenase